MYCLCKYIYSVSTGSSGNEKYETKDNGNINNDKNEDNTNNVNSAESHKQINEDVTGQKEQETFDLEAPEYMPV